MIGEQIPNVMQMNTSCDNGEGGRDCAQGDLISYDAPRPGGTVFRISFGLPTDIQRTFAFGTVMSTLPARAPLLGLFLERKSIKKNFNALFKLLQFQALRPVTIVCFL